jgi:HK97 family phage prohead protease
MPDRVTETQTVSIPPMTRTGAFLSDTIDEESRTIELVFTTGAQVRRFDWFDGEYLEELSVKSGAVRMERLNNGAPLLDSHRSHSLDGMLGVVETAKIKKGEGIATVRFARGFEAAEKVWNLVKDGIVRNVSVGYRVHELNETKKKAGVRVLRADDWEPYEVSLVAVGADAGAGIRSDDVLAAPCNLTRTMPKGTTEMDNQNQDDREVRSGNDDADEPKNGGDVRKASEADSTRNDAKEIMEICELAGASMREANAFIQGDKTPAQVRSALLEKRDAGLGNDAEISGQHQPSDGIEQRGLLAGRMADTHKISTKGN